MLTTPKAFTEDLGNIVHLIEVIQGKQENIYKEIEHKNFIFYILNNFADMKGVIHKFLWLSFALIDPSLANSLTLSSGMKIQLP